MAVITGTNKGCNLVAASVNGAGARKVYELVYNFAAYTGASDSATVTGIPTVIANHTRNGKTNTLRSAICAGPGLDTANQAVYTNALTVSTNDLTFNLASADGTELTSSTACEGVRIFVVVDES